MTNKQIAVAKDLLENTGKSVSKAMIDAGYAPASAKNPQQLTRSKSWQKLMRQIIPDEELIQKHKELLNATKMGRLTLPFVMHDEEAKHAEGILSRLGAIHYYYGGGNNKTFIYYIHPDRRIQLHALALAYKIKGKLQSNVLLTGEKVVAILQSTNISQN